MGSVFGHDAEEFARLAAAMEACGVVAVELNLSCPHAEGLGAEIGQDPEAVAEISARGQARRPSPRVVKITPNVAEPETIAGAAERAGADAIVAINTVRALAIDVELRRPVLAHGLGGLGGPAIKPIGLACVWKVAEKVRIPIVGVGEISSARDAPRYLMAGASALEVGTAVLHGGAAVFGSLARDLGALLEELGLGSVRESVGLAHAARQAH